MPRYLFTGTIHSAAKILCAFALPPWKNSIEHCTTRKVEGAPWSQLLALCWSWAGKARVLFDYYKQQERLALVVGTTYNSVATWVWRQGCMTEKSWRLSSPSMWNVRYICQSSVTDGEKAEMLLFLYNWIYAKNCTTVINCLGRKSEHSRSLAQLSGVEFNGLTHSASRNRELLQ